MLRVLREYSINESGFGYVVNLNTASVKKVHSINESEPCLNSVSLAT